MSGRVRVRELAGWGLDESARRDGAMGAEAVQARTRVAEARVAEREARGGWNALKLQATSLAAERLRREMGREDLRREMEGLEWEVGMVKMERLVAVQRRLLLGEVGTAWDRWKEEAVGRKRRAMGQEGKLGMEGLMGLAFGAVRRAAYEMWVEEGGFGLRSGSPDLRLRMTAEGGLAVDGGSPFLEVAEWRGRWFLRDGYHRAYALLRAGVRCVPAVIVRARGIEEVRATAMGFFGEAEMRARRPPRVVDFLDDRLCLEYTQPRLVKRVRIRVEEWMEEETEA